MITLIAVVIRTDDEALPMNILERKEMKDDVPNE